MFQIFYKFNEIKSVFWSFLHIVLVKKKESDYLNMQNARTTYLTILLIVGLSDGDRFPGKLQMNQKKNRLNFPPQFLCVNSMAFDVAKIP